MTPPRSAPLLAETGATAWLHVCRDDGRMARFAAALAFFHPGLDVLTFPAWDCLPYDRVSPNGDIVSRRIDVLTRLAGGQREAAVRAADDRQRARAARAAAPIIRRPRAEAGCRRPHPARPSAGVFPQQRLYPHRHGARAGRVRGARRHRRSLAVGRATADPARFLRRHARKPARLRPADAAFDRSARQFRACARSARCCSTTPRSSVSARAIARRSARSAPTTRSTNRSAPGGGRPAWSTGCRSITRRSKRCSTTCRGAAVSLDHQAEEARAHRLESIADFYAARADDQRRRRAAPRRCTAR